MPTAVARSDVQRLVADGSQLVEVLPLDEYVERRERRAHRPRTDSRWRTSTAGDRGGRDGRGRRQCERTSRSTRCSANAVAASPADATVALRRTSEAGVITLEVTNQVTDSVSPAHRWDLDDPLRTGGRGLLIVSALVDHIEVEHVLTNLCTVVRARRNVASTVQSEAAQAEIADLEPKLRI